MKDRYQQLKDLIEKYKKFRKEADPALMSEETARVWINDFLRIFDWDVRDTSQIVQEKTVSKYQQKKLEKINSPHTTPDYTFVNGKIVKTYLDAKKAGIDLFRNKDAAFQIRSYGWSAGIPCAFLSNFEQLVIFDCKNAPSRDTAADTGTIQLSMDSYLEHFDLLDAHFDRLSVYQNNLEKIYSTHRMDGGKTIDVYFNELLAQFRIDLANKIYSDNQSMRLNEEELNYYVQLIIDRIIFIRVCESRGIEEPELLKKYAQTDFWNKFKESCYVKFYEHYDGAMFSRSVTRFAELKIENQVFENFIRQLYYPYPYRFDVIPVKVIAKVYEEFLAYSLVIKNGRVSVALKDDYVKTNGAIPTDEKIVEIICNETIDTPSIHSVEDIWNTHILDPCCGSGIFLVAAYEKLSERLKKLAVKDAPELCVTDGTEIYLTITARQKLMRSCLYGIDIDPTAVEVTKMSLALKIIDDANPGLYVKLGIFGEKILHEIDRNIVCGNTLVSTDITLSHEEIPVIKPVNIKNGLFQTVFQKIGGFTYIIGNPPYVETKHFKAASKTMHQYLRNNYHSFQGKADLSVLFIERCMDLLKPKGRIGMIIQRRWFKTSYGKNARNVIAKNCYLKKLFDIGTTDLFPGRITYVSIIVLEKNKCQQVEYDYIPGSKYDILNYFEERSPKNVIPESYFEENIWAPEFYEIVSIKNKYAQLLGTLGENPDIHIRDGIQALWKKIYHLTDCSTNGAYINGTNGFGEQVCLEKDIVKPVIYNKAFLPLKTLCADAFCLFPYKDMDNRTKIPITELQHQYPKTYDYLNKNKEKILSQVKCNTGEYWHTFTREHNHEWFDSKKIIVPMTSKDTFASYESQRSFYMDNANVWFLTIDSGSDIIYKAAIMIINSTVFSVFAKSGANPQSNGYYKFNKQFLAPVPFPNSNLQDTNTIVNELAAYHDDINELLKAYDHADEQIRFYYAGIMEQKWGEADLLCNKLYGLSDPDWAKIQKIGRTLNRVTGKEVSQ